MGQLKDYSAGVLVTLYTEASSRKQAQEFMLLALERMEAAAEAQGVEFEYELQEVAQGL